MFVALIRIKMYFNTLNYSFYLNIDMTKKISIFEYNIDEQKIYFHQCNFHYGL